MYYKIMKIAVKPNLKSKTFATAKNCTPLLEKEIISVSFRFYQKLFVVLISLFTILIFPESPKDLENVCNTYNSRKSCNVW